MSKDPYQVLGIDRNASDEEIKRAYKELARKYHPDKYNNNPLAELAEEKMREINEAYDTLMKGDRRTAGGSSGYGNNGYGGNSYGGAYGQGPFGQGGAYGGGYANSDASIFMQVRACINNGNIAYADSLLSKINNHNAEWYFLKGIVFLRQGRVTEGAEYINRAAQMNPSNQEYARMAQQVNNSNFDFRQTSVNSGYGMGNDMCCASPCGMCETLLCMNLCCNCCN